MGVYIKGFIPTDGLYQIQDRVIRKYKGKGGTVRPYDLVEVKEPHGRLIDADEAVVTTEVSKVRLIDADVLVAQWEVDAEQVEDVVAKMFIYGAIHDVKHAPTIETEQQWIPCSERLPEEKGEYLVAYHPCHWDDVEDEVKVGVDSFRGKTSWAKQKYQRVIAWMPLPPVYQEEDNK